MPLLDLSQGFAYRGEGNANLVVALPQSRIILRFPKSKFSEKSQCEKLEAICRYINLVMRPEMPQYVDPVTIGMLDWAQFQLVRERVGLSRPASRLGKDIYYPAALVMPDCALRPPLSSAPSAPLLAIEIKPKLGLFSGPGLCKFCLKQYYKLHVTKEVDRRSQYCPMDLFSGDSARMSRAIKALLDAPQNNLRLLVDGVPPPYGQDPGKDGSQEVVASLLGSQDVLVPVLVACLLHSPNQVASIRSASPTLSTKAGKDRCTPSHAGSLPKGCILDTIQKLQGRSPLSDIEALELLESLLEKGEEIGQLQEEMTKPAAPGDRLQPLKDYLLLVTARDLSLILTLAEAGTSERPPVADCLRVREQWICFRWSVIDLDPKSLNRIPKNVEQQKLWMEAFLRNRNL